ncbi:MAG: hypothetical protein KTR31_33855 [Myxococcales bacterium]|nr:hypothetical protein [Myxococcales bacterium]
MHVALVPDEAFRGVAQRLHLPIERDPDAARRAGVAYERHVQRTLLDE